VPSALDRAVEGLDRVAVIVRALREFAHPDRTEMAPADLNHAVESTLTITRNEYKYVADLETEYGELPLVRCHAGEVNQVVLNIVVNAAHAIEGAVKGTEHRGRIAVCTYRDGDDAVITVSDTGPGIPEAIREQIFDPFFTTKEIGKGTGQGLAIARNVIVEKHGGDLRFETTMGVGTTFFIRLPIDGPKSLTSEAPAPEARAA
jgi:signal transduction histidine kinase